ncbi:MAG: hypothetical protein GY856_36445 [bacterium]|nr:hypothetical protein [bacterium]
MGTRGKRRALLVAAIAGIAMSVALPAASDSLDVQVWWLRLTVEADPNLEDPGNLLGRLSDSLDDYDYHDLPEMPPFGTPYLTIVFPHPEWEDYPGDYTSDYREARPGAGGTWDFEVRSDVAREITLLWDGSSGLVEILPRSTLVNEETSETVTPQSGGSYTTTMIGTVHRFSWRVNEVPLFADGFESGDLTAWSQVMGD